MLLRNYRVSSPFSSAEMTSALTAAKPETCILVTIFSLPRTTRRVVATIGQTSGNLLQVAWTLAATLEHLVNLKVAGRSIRIAEDLHASLRHFMSSGNRDMKILIPAHFITKLRFSVYFGRHDDIAVGRLLRKKDILFNTALQIKIQISNEISVISRSICLKVP